MAATKILIIDDEPSILFTISEICSYCGYDAITATSGQEGLDIVQSEVVDLIILDYNMPGWDGLMTTKKIKAYNSQIPIMILTIDEQQQTADKFMEAGANDFSIKPIKAPDLIARMKMNLQIGQMQQQMQQKKEDRYIEKGISYATLCVITEYLKKQEESVTFEDITSNVNLAYQTVHRYVKFLENNDSLEITPIYGQLGRPKINTNLWIILILMLYNKKIPCRVIQRAWNFLMFIQQDINFFLIFPPTRLFRPNEFHYQGLPDIFQNQLMKVSLLRY